MTATIQDPSQAGWTTLPLSLTSPTPIAGPFVALSTASIGTSPLSTYNWSLGTQLPHFIAAVAQGTAKVVALGDSTTRGYGSADQGWDQTAYPSELAQMLTQNGVPAQSDNFLGAGGFYATGTDLRVTLVGTANWDGNAVDAGGPGLQTLNADDGFNFTIDTPTVYDGLKISYIDQGSGKLSVAVDGGAVITTLKFHNTGNTLTRYIGIPPGIHQSVQARQVGTAPTYIQGASFRSSAQHSIQVMNAGIGGWTSVGANTSYCLGSDILGSACGFGQTAGVAALRPALVIIDLGINDILTGVPEATTASSIAQIVTTLKAAGSDVMLMIPGPFSAPNYSTAIAALETDMRALALQDNLPLIDLSATYNYDFPTLSAAGLMGSDSVHPDATLYADTASAIAVALAQTLGAVPLHK